MSISIYEILSWDAHKFGDVAYGAEIEWVLDVRDRLIQFQDNLFTAGHIESYRRDRYDLYDKCLVFLDLIDKITNGYHPRDMVTY